MSHEDKRRRACPDCPDGYVWKTSGPTNDACPTCGGNAYIEIIDGPHRIKATASPYDMNGAKEYPGE
jgi:hypothetical protein